jgi:hypothetical protein
MAAVHGMALALAACSVGGPGSLPCPADALRPSLGGVKPNTRHRK